MKLKYYLIVALFGTALFVSCTPESINDGQTDQQVDGPSTRPPVHG